MEERGGKTIMCSVLFLDIVEYSKRSVSGQISLKDRFNSYLSAAISSVPVDDRIILDTGDGAAINFLGDVEDALKAALSLRESILNEGPNQDPPLLVRAGINLGPVRLVRDINGQPNIVGDGINVAQRIMAFADADQILVSRSYFDAVSRLSPQYTGMFSYQGSRTDKHVREHEVYAIGHLGEKTAELIATNLHEIQKVGLPERLSASIREGWNALALGCNNATGSLKSRFAQADSRQRALYAGAVILPVALVGALVFKLAHNGEEAPTLSDAEQMQAASGVQPASAVASEVASGVAPAVASGVASAVSAADTRVAGKADGTGNAQAAAKLEAKKAAAGKSDKTKSIEGNAGSKSADAPAKYQDMQQHKPAEPSHKKSDPVATDSGTEHFTAAFIALICKEGTQLFVDGQDKGKVVSTGLSVTVTPGSHKVIVTSKGGDLFTQNVELEPGKTLRLKPNFCD